MKLNDTRGVPVVDAPSLNDEALRIADMAMWEQFLSHMHGGKDNCYAFPGPDDMDSDPAHEAVRWLQRRGYVKLEQDDAGDYARVVKEPGASDHGTKAHVPTLARRAADLHEKAGMPLDQARELALSEAGITSAAENQWFGDMMILQVLADSDQVNEQEREVLTRWMAASAIGGVKGLDISGVDGKDSK